MAIDRAALAQLRALDQETGGGLFAELLELFHDGTPLRLASIRRALAAGDARQVEREAHSLKGSSGALGAIGLMQLAGELEHRARAGDLSDAGQQVEAIEAEFRAAGAELVAAQQEIPG